MRSLAPAITGSLILAAIIAFIVYVVLSQPIDITGTYRVHYTTQVAVRGGGEQSLGLSERRSYPSPYTVTVSAVASSYRIVIRNDGEDRVVGRVTVDQSEDNRYDIIEHDEDGALVLEAHLRARRRGISGTLWIPRFQRPMDVVLRQPEGDALGPLPYVLFALLGILGFHQVLLRALRLVVHTPDPVFLSFWYDTKLRLKTQPVLDVVTGSHLHAGMHVVDAGCGTGTMTIPFARDVGPEGRVYAIDIHQRNIESLHGKIRHQASDTSGIIEPICGDVHTLPLEDASVDRVIFVSSLWETRDRAAVLKEAKRVLKPDGIVVISECALDPDYLFLPTLYEMLEEAGFAIHANRREAITYTLMAEIRG